MRARRQPESFSQTQTTDPTTGMANARHPGFLRDKKTEKSKKKDKT
jgi:hypothetical protein